MIKICHLISSCMVNHGPSNIIIPIVVMADKKKYQLSVCSLYPPPSASNPDLIFSESNIPFNTLNMGSFFDVSVIPKLVSYLKINSPDILHCHLVRANVYGRIAAKIAGVPVVICSHHGIEDHMISGGFFNSVIRLFERLTSNMVSCYVGVSKVMGMAIARYLQFDSKKIFVINNGIDLSKYKDLHVDSLRFRNDFGLRHDSLLIGSVGHLNKTKNFEVFLYIAKLLVVLNCNVQFLVFGEGPSRDALEALIDKLKLRNIVFLLGFRSDIPKMLNNLDIFCTTSTSEGFGLSVAEAMACGLPCVAFDVGALHELIADGETGFLIPPFDINKFSDALNDLVNDHSLRKRLGTAGRNYANHNFSLNRMVSDYQNLYDKFEKL